MPEASWLSTYPGAGGVAALVVVTAFLVNRFAPAKRKFVRRTVLLLLVYLAAFGVSMALGAAEASSWLRTARLVCELAGDLTLISAVAVILFEIALPAIRVELAPIVTDISVGLAYAIAGIVSMRRAGVDLSGIVATSAVVTGILALSLQATLGNVIGGVALQIDKSIRVGDWIQLEDGKQGRVREIRWRHTVIETRDWDTLVVPNATLLSATILILGKRQGAALQHRMWVHFHVDFRFPPAEVINVVEQALRAAPIEGVAADPPPNCVCMDLGRHGSESFASYAVRYWLTDLARDDPTSSLVRARVHAALRRAGIPLAVPGQHLWVERDDAERRERKQRRDLERCLHALQQVDILKPLRQAELERIAEQLRYAPFAAGEVITRQGATAHWLYVVLSGVAEVRVERDGVERPVAQIRAPGFFGEMALMTGEPRTATVIAVTDVECYRLDKESFDQILHARPEIAAEISTVLAKRRVELEAAACDLDPEARRSRLDDEERRLLSVITRFFGLERDADRA